MSEHKKKKAKQLGMNPSTAGGRLRKTIIFNFAQKLNLDICFQCGEKIGSIEEFSIEHKIPWLNSETPVDLFFNLDNIAFSHLSCNCKAARKPNKIDVSDGTQTCRMCGIVKELEEFGNRKINASGKDTECLECSRERVKLDKRKRRAEGKRN